MNRTLRDILLGLSASAGIALGAFGGIQLLNQSSQSSTIEERVVAQVDEGQVTPEIVNKTLEPAPKTPEELFKEYLERRDHDVSLDTISTWFELGAEESHGPAITSLLKTKGVDASFIGRMYQDSIPPTFAAVSEISSFSSFIPEDQLYDLFRISRDHPTLSLALNKLQRGKDGNWEQQRTWKIVEKYVENGRSVEHIATFALLSGEFDGAYMLDHYVEDKFELTLELLGVKGLLKREGEDLSDLGYMIRNLSEEIKGNPRREHFAALSTFAEKGDRSKYDVAESAGNVSKKEGLIDYVDIFAPHFSDVTVYGFYHLGVSATPENLEKAESFVRAGVDEVFVPTLLEANVPLDKADYFATFQKILNFDDRARELDFTREVNHPEYDSVTDGADMIDGAASLLVSLLLHDVPNTPEKREIVSEFGGKVDQQGLCGLLINDVPFDYIKAMYEEGSRGGSEILELYLSDISPEDARALRRFSFRRTPINTLMSISFSDSEKEVAIPTGMFSPKVSWDDLRDGDVIRIGVWDQPGDPPHWSLRDLWNREYNHDLLVSRMDYRLEGKGIELLYLKNKDQVEEALFDQEGEDLHFDVLYLTGHANVGRGPNMNNPKETPSYIRMGKDHLVIPRRYVRNMDDVERWLDEDLALVKGNTSGIDGKVIDVDVLVYICCRGNVYYTQVLDEHAPQTEFVSTGFNAYGARVSVARQLIHTIEQGKPLSRFVDVTRRLMAFNIGSAHQWERQVYKTKAPEQGYSTDMLADRQPVIPLLEGK